VVITTYFRTELVCANNIKILYQEESIMSYAEWKDRIDSFKKVDVRGIQGNFFQGLKKQAMDLPAGEGMEVIQSFEPIPLYEVMEGLGYERRTEKKGDAEFHAYFYRSEIKTEEKDIPMRPVALTNMPLIDEKLGNIIEKKGLREIRRPILTSSFDEYLFLFGKLLFVLLRKGEIQNSMLEACLDIFFGDVLADIEASLH